MSELKTENVYWRRAGNSLDMKVVYHQENKMGWLFKRILGQGGPFSVTIYKRWSMEYHYNLSFKEYLFWNWIKLRYKIHRLKAYKRKYMF